MLLIEIGLFFSLLGGVLFKLFPPKNINSIYGWRSRMSMKNIDTWTEAQRYGANAFITGGLILAALGGIIQVAMPHLNDSILAALVFLCTAAIIYSGEAHLRKIFDKNGSRRF